MSKMVCKYNFQNSEKFNGEPYCCLFHEKCKDLNFVCDKNCQVYEDYKQLEELKAENKELKEELEELKEENEYNEANAIEFKQTLTEIKEIAEKYKNLNFGEQQYCYSEILRKISEVEDE